MSLACDDVIVAEDNPVIRALITRLLTSLGYSVTALSDGQALLNYVKTNFDPYATSTTLPIIFTDYNMPNMDGIAAAEDIRNSYKNSRIVLVTSDMTDSLASLAKQHVDALLYKPVTKEMLEHVICTLESSNCKLKVT
jgi:CheY-like chemotaxis protein